MRLPRGRWRDVTVLSNALLLGLAAPLKARLGPGVACYLQDEDEFIDALNQGGRRSLVDPPPPGERGGPVHRRQPLLCRQDDSRPLTAGADRGRARWHRDGKLPRSLVARLAATTRDRLSLAAVPLQRPGPAGRGVLPPACGGTFCRPEAAPCRRGGRRGPPAGTSDTPPPRPGGRAGRCEFLPHMEMPARTNSSAA